MALCALTVRSVDGFVAILGEEQRCRRTTLSHKRSRHRMDHRDFLLIPTVTSHYVNFIFMVPCIVTLY